MKRVALLLATLFFSCTLYASSLFIGGGLGLNLNFIRAGKGYRDYKYLPFVGLNFSLPLDFDITDDFSLLAEPRVITKTYKKQRNATYKGKSYKTIDLNYIYTYLELPVTLNYLGTINDENKYSLGGGIYLGYMVGGIMEGNVLNESLGALDHVEEDADLEHLNKFQYGLALKGSYILEKSKHRHMFSLEYDLALSPLNIGSSVNNFPLYNSTLILSYSLLWSVK